MLDATVEEQIARGSTSPFALPLSLLPAADTKELTLLPGACSERLRSTPWEDARRAASAAAGAAAAATCMASSFFWLNLKERVFPLFFQLVALSVSLSSSALRAKNERAENCKEAEQTNERERERENKKTMFALCVGRERALFSFFTPSSSTLRPPRPPPSPPSPTSPEAPPSLPAPRRTEGPSRTSSASSGSCPSVGPLRSW